MPVLHHPVPDDLARLLRTAVLEVRAGLQRRPVPCALHLGTPGAARTSWTLTSEQPADQAGRSDLVAALLGRHQRAAPEGPALVWLTRPGPLAWHDEDQRWLPPATRAFAEADQPLTWVVVNRQGWWDPRGDAGRVWRRLRPRHD